MSVLRGLLVGLGTFVLLGVLVSAGGRALAPIELLMFWVIVIVTGVAAGRRHATSAARARDR